MTFLVRTHRGPRGVVSVEELSVRYAMRTKLMEVRETPIGPIGMSVPNGVHRDRLTINVRGDDAKRSDGLRPGTIEQIARCDTTAASVKATVRALRPQEAEAIAEIDAEIAELRGWLESARERRDVAVREAFTKGHVVPVARLREIADANA